MYIDYKGLWKLYFAQFIGEWYTLLMLDLFTLKTVIILHVSLHLVLVMILVVYFFLYAHKLFIHLGAQFRSQMTTPVGVRPLSNTRAESLNQWKNFNKDYSYVYHSATREYI
jgi:hypothetical protein